MCGVCLVPGRDGETGMVVGEDTENGGAGTQTHLVTAMFSVLNWMLAAAAGVAKNVATASYQTSDVFWGFPAHTKMCRKSCAR